MPMLLIHRCWNVHSRLILSVWGHCHYFLWSSHIHRVKNGSVNKKKNTSLHKHSHEPFKSIFLLFLWPGDSLQSQHSLCPILSIQSHFRCTRLFYFMDIVYLTSLLPAASCTHELRWHHFLYLISTLNFGMLVALSTCSLFCLLWRPVVSNILHY